MLCEHYKSQIGPFVGCRVFRDLGSAAGVCTIQHCNGPLNRVQRAAGGACLRHMLAPTPALGCPWGISAPKSEAAEEEGLAMGLRLVLCRARCNDLA